MKAYRKALVIGLALLGPAVAGAEPAQAGTEPGALGQGPAGPRLEHWERFMDERLTALQQALKLTGAQEADWNTWSTTVNRLWTEKKEARPDFEALKNLPAPDRLEKMLAFAKAKQSHLEEVLAATKTLYATLTPEQRKVFDDLMPLGERAPKWMHHGGRRHPPAP